MTIRDIAVLIFLAGLGLVTGGLGLFFALVIAAGFAGAVYGIIILMEKRYDSDDTSG